MPSKSKTRELSENQKKAEAYFASKKRVRGDEQIIDGKMLVARQMHPRWIASVADLPFRAPGDAVVIVAEKYHFGARAIARRYLAAIGLIEAAEVAQVKAWIPNCKMPTKVVLLSLGPAGDLVIENHEFILET
jgi:hypothetical protein